MSCNNSGGSMTRGLGRNLKHSTTKHSKKNNFSKGSHGKNKTGYAKGNSSKARVLSNGQYKKPGMLVMKRSYGKPIKYHHELCIPSWIWWLIAAIVILAVILIIAL